MIICFSTGIEGYWEGVKRQLDGTHHGVNRNHLHRCLSKAELKYNSRKLTDGERTVTLIQAAAARRLTYKQQTARNRDTLGRHTDR